jgi:hypothetical protein
MKRLERPHPVPRKQPTVGGRFAADFLQKAASAAASGIVGNCSGWYGSRGPDAISRLP